MVTRKILQIADSVHGTIRASELEKQIISTQAFNRLHNILQNSTAYLTYPSNQTKRFTHSLGAMHLAGQMFLSSITNADIIVRKDFFTKVAEKIDLIIENKAFGRILRDKLGKHVENILKDYKYIFIDDPFYITNTPAVIKEEHRFLYVVMLEVVRCTALLHDAGHPPFSHVTEGALKKVLATTNGIQEGQRTPRQRTFIEATKAYYGQKDKEGKDLDLHEVIGSFIADRLLEHVERLNEAGGLTRDKGEIHLFYLLIHSLTLGVLKEENNFFKNIHQLIASSIDCDRLDYVTRDIENSGFIKGRVEYDRLISTMKLMKVEDEFVFCPDIRALSSIEHFFHLRWHLYKYIVLHHRVSKTDYLLGEVLVKLATDYLENTEIDTLRLNKHVLPIDISGLWRAIQPDVISDEVYFNSLIQWDDAWLLTVLRQQYYEKYKDEEHIVKYQLEELLSNKKRYHSVVKRMNDFLEIDMATVENFKVVWPQIELETQQNKWLQELKASMEQFQVKDHKGDPPKKIPAYFSAQGFFLLRLKMFFEILEVKEFETIVGKSINRVAESAGIKNCAVVFKKLKTGLEDPPNIHRGDDVVILSDVSRLGAEMVSNKGMFPVFYIYSSQNVKDLSGFRREVGKAIAEDLSVFLTSDFAPNTLS